MILTFLDAGVLIAVARGPDTAAAHALAVLNDPAREFATSLFVQLEVVPKALFNKRAAESKFYREFFGSVRHWANSEETCRLALEIASESGLGALDALHVAAAVVVGAAELISTEHITKPLHRTKRLKIMSLRDIPITGKLAE